MRPIGKSIPPGTTICTWKAGATVAMCITPQCDLCGFLITREIFIKLNPVPQWKFFEIQQVRQGLLPDLLIVHLKYWTAAWNIRMS